MTFVERPEDGCSHHFPFNLTELERICQQERDKLSKSWSAKLAETLAKKT